MSRTAPLLVLFLSVLAGPAFAAADPAADTILNQYVEAIGGKTKLSQIKTRVSKMKISAGWISVKGESRQQWPDRAQDEISGLGMKMAGGYDGKTAWLKEPAKDPRTLQGREAQQFILGHRLDRMANLQSVYPDRRVLPDETVEGRKVHRVGLTAPGCNEEIWSVDAETRLLVMVESQKEDFKDGGKLTPIKTVLEDYREVDGIKLPFRMRGDDGKSKSSIEFESVVHNQPVTINLPEALAGK